MKKFAAIFISIMLIALMAISPVVSAATTATADFSRDVAARKTANTDTVRAGTANGTLTLEKYEYASGNTAVNTPTKQNPVTGATFTAYRIYDLSEAGLFTVNSNFSGVTELATYIAKDNGLTYTSTKDLEALIPTLQTASAGKSAADDGVYNSVEKTELKEGKQVGTGVYEFNSLPLGVYLVVETGVPAGYVVSSKSFLVSIPQWDENNSKWDFDITAYPKNDKIPMDKVITNGETGSDKSDAKNIGDKVEYKITSKIPSYDEDDNKKLDSTKMKYIFTDTMSQGLTYNKDLVAKIGDKTFEATTDSSDKKDYQITVATVGTNTVITVEFNWTSITAYQGKEITLVYSATINEKAVAGTANKNAANLEYTNDPTSNSGPKYTKTPDSETKVYTYEMNLNKTFNGEAPNDTNEIDARGVEFTLKDSKGNLIKFVKESDGVYYVYGNNFTAEDADGKVTKTGAVDKVSPKKDGSLVIRGLDEGTYILSEVSSIEGWSKLASDVEIILVAGKSGDPEVFDGTLKSATANPGNKSLTINKRGAADASGVFTIEVNNVKKQFDLPLTGGAGLLMFTIGGGVAIAGAIIIFSLLRKKTTK